MKALKIKRIFESAEMVKLESPLGEGFDVWTCEIKDEDNSFGCHVQLYGPTQLELESIRDYAMFGLNESDKLKAENVRLEDRVRQLEITLNITKRLNKKV